MRKQINALIMVGTFLILLLIPIPDVYGQVGMLSWWPGDGNANDVVDGNHGTLNGGTTFAPGVVGQAFSFDGVNAFLDIPDSSNLNPTTAFTIEGWFYIDPYVPGNAGDVATLVAKSNGSSWGGGWFLIFDDRFGLLSKSLRFEVFQAQGQWAIARVDNIITTPGWYHVAGVFDLTGSPQTKLYLNGSLVASSAQTIQCVLTNLYSMRIGAMHWNEVFSVPGYSDRFNGLADEVTYYNVALTETQIQQIYLAGSFGKYGLALAFPPLVSIDPPVGSGTSVQLSTEPVSWWPGDGNANDTMGANHGTLQGGATFAPGVVGEAFSFDGVNAFVDIPNSSNLNPTTAFTIEGWFHIDPYAPGNLRDLSTLAAKSDGSSASGGWFLVFDDRSYVDGYCLSKSLRFEVFQGQYQWARARVDNIITTPGWYHVAGVFDLTGSPQTELYLNGSLVGSSTETVSSILANDYSMRIGAMHWNETFRSGWPVDASDRFNGLADEVTYYNVALTETQIQQIYLAGSFGKRGANQAPVANAGPDRTVHVGASVTLDGSGSTDANGDVLTYTWSLVSRPAGSLAQLANLTDVTTSFVADMPGIYVVSLVVNDGFMSRYPRAYARGTRDQNPNSNWSFS